MVTAAPQRFQVDILPVDDGTPRVVTNLGLQWLEYTDGQVTPACPQLGLLLRLFQEKGLGRRASSPFSTLIFVMDNSFADGDVLMMCADIHGFPRIWHRNFLLLPAFVVLKSKQNPRKLLCLFLRSQH